MEIFIILTLILLNGLFSMAEISLISARKSKLESEAKRGSISSKMALKLSSDPDTFLSSVQIGITLIGILTGLYSGDKLSGYVAVWIPTQWMSPDYALGLSKVVIVIIVTYLTLVFGELVPKRIGMSYAESVAKMVAAPMNIISKVASPFIWLLSKSTTLILRLFGIQAEHENTITEEEIKAIIQESTEGGEIQEVEQDIVGRVFNLGDRNVSSIMTHRSELVYLNTDADKEAVKDKVVTHLFNVYPVVEGGLDHLKGVVYLKDLFGTIDNVDFNLADYIRPPYYLPHTISVYDALEKMRDERIKYSLLTDEFGSILGIITLKDIIEALVGTMPEAGEEQDIVVREDGSVLVDGQCSFYEFLEYFEMQDLYNELAYNTISGLILEELDRIPSTGEKLEWKDLILEIVDMDGARIDKVLVLKKTIVKVSHSSGRENP